MAIHYRRKQLREAVTTMYLDNIKRAKTYTEVAQLERYLAAVRDGQQESELRQAKDHEHDRQLGLF